MRPKMFDYDVADASLTGLASNVTGAAFTITTASPTDGLSHQLSIRNDTTTDHSAKTVTLVGKDQDGKALTEIVTGPGTSATVESSYYFSSLTSATPSATIGTDTFDIGWVDEISGKTIPLDWCSPFAANIAVDVTGTINYSVQETFSDVLGGTAAVWTDITAFSAKTADVTGQAAIGATAIRLIVNSYSSGAEIQMYVSQTGNN